MPSCLIILNLLFNSLIPVAVIQAATICVNYLVLAAVSSGVQVLST